MLATRLKKNSRAKSMGCSLSIEAPSISGRTSPLSDASPRVSGRPSPLSNPNHMRGDVYFPQHVPSPHPPQLIHPTYHVS